MKELLKKIRENAENPNEVDLTEQGIREAAKKLGYSDAEIEVLLSNFDGFPLNEDDLSEISGGVGIYTPSVQPNPESNSVF